MKNRPRRVDHNVPASHAVLIIIIQYLYYVQCIRYVWCAHDGYGAGLKYNYNVIIIIKKKNEYLRQVENQKIPTAF
jgi:hypothetical protein